MHGCKQGRLVRAYVSSGSTPTMPHFNFRRVQAHCSFFCLQTNQYWRYDFSEEELAHCCGSSNHLQSQDNISVNALELLDMVMSTCMLVVACGECPVGDRDCVLLRDGNEAVVHWVGC